MPPRQTACLGRAATRCRHQAFERISDAARRRLDEAADGMARALLGIAESAESEAVKLRAIAEALDRAGMQAPTAVEVDVAVKPWQDVIAGMRGVRFGPRPARSDRQPALESPDDVMDAEVVDEDDTEWAPLRPHANEKAAD